MKPILRSIQTKLIETLKASEIKNTMTVVASDAFSVDELISLKVAQTLAPHQPWRHVDSHHEFQHRHDTEREPICAEGGGSPEGRNGCSGHG